MPPAADLRHRAGALWLTPSALADDFVPFCQ
jgi:hypothetical protein